MARLGTSRASWTSAYGAVLAVKIAAIVVLGAMGWAHRRWTLDLLRRGRPRAFTRLAGVEMLVMGATFGVAVALSRTPGPVDQANLERLGRTAGPGLVEPYSLAQLAHDWRPEPVLSTLVLLALTAYLSTARGRGRSADPWPIGRSTAALGAATLAVVTIGLPTAYDDRPLLAVQVAQTLVLALVVPPLVVLARPLTLRDRGSARPALPELRWLAPFPGFVVLVATVAIVLQPPVRHLSATSTPAHLVVLAAALVAGAWFVGGLLAPGASPRQRTEILGATAVFLAALAAALAAAPGPGAATAMAAAQLAHEQRAASVTAWCAALGVAVATALLIRRNPAGPVVDARVSTA